MRNRPVLVTFVLGAIAAAIGVALGLTINWFPQGASTQAHRIDTLYDVLVIVSVPVFVLVATVVLFSVWRFRMRPGDEQRDGPPIHGHTKLEVVWTAVPAVLLISLCSYAYVVLQDFESQASGREINVDVTAQQFAWQFSYPSATTGGAPVTATELYLPQGRAVRFHVRSRDVIHAFYVPAFRLQIDAVPGQSTDVRATPNRLGTYLFVCAELCGLGHAAMRSTVHVLTPAAFGAWVRSRQRAGNGGQGPAPPSGSPGPGEPGAAPAPGARVPTGAAPARASADGPPRGATARRADTLPAVSPSTGVLGRRLEL